MKPSVPRLRFSSTANGKIIAPHVESAAVVIIRKRGLAGLYARELWKYRELLYLLTLREVKVRYKETVLGVLWAILQPLLTMSIFAVVFSRMMPLKNPAVPYPLFALTGLIPWMFFANALTNGTSSLVSNKNLITKVYFPRAIIPISTVLTGAVDAAFASLFLIIILFISRVPLTYSCLLVAPIILLTLLASVGAGLWLSALNVKYRDIRYAVPFLTQLWMLASPVAYPSSLISGHWEYILPLNPMFAIIEGCRAALLSLPWPSAYQLIVSIISSLSLCVTGYLYFRSVERTFADKI